MPWLAVATAPCQIRVGRSFPGETFQQDRAAQLPRTKTILQRFIMASPAGLIWPEKTAHLIAIIMQPEILMPEIAPSSQTDAGPRARRFRSGGLDLNYTEWGDPAAPVLLLMHGGHDQGRSWDFVAQRLATNWRVIAPDMRGHGDSATPPDGSYLLADLIADVAALVASLGVAQVTFVAHSMGGMVALNYAGLHPERVRKMVVAESMGVLEATRAWIAELKAAPPAPAPAPADTARPDKAAETAPRPPAPTSEEFLAQAAARMRKRNPRLPEELALHLTRHAYRQRADGSWQVKTARDVDFNDIAAISDAELHRRWGAITCPVLLIQGELTDFPKPTQESHFRHFRNAREVEMKGVGHWPHHEGFETFMREVDAFL
jgi:pimeloyl-ACP methyl ester carboxylesterase